MADSNKRATRTEVTEILLGTAVTQGWTYPKEVRFCEDPSPVPAVELRFDTSEQMRPWLDFFGVEKDRFSRRQQTLDDGSRLHNATAFDWNGWQQVTLTACDPPTQVAS